MTISSLLFATGRRKTAVARVQLTTGSGKIEINHRSLEQYFPTEDLQNHALQVLHFINRLNAFDVSILVHGGGLNGQAGAICHALSRALIRSDPSLRGPLKKGGFLTRDPRMKERKKPGQPGARRRFQFSKR